LFAQTPVTVYRQLNAENGLSHNYVSAIEQDEHGFIWLASQFGLNRYDGREVVPFFNDPADSTSMSSNDINDIDIAADGQLWIAHYVDGVDHYDPVAETFTHYAPPNTASWVQADGNGGVWSGGHNGLSYKSAVADSFTLHTVTRHPWLLRAEHPFVKKLYRDRTGTVWVATSRGLYRPGPAGEPGAWFLPRDERYRAADTTFVISDLAEDTHGRLWAATQVGLFYYSPDSAALLPYRNAAAGNQPFAGKQIDAIAAASTGQLWLSLSGEGLCRHDPQAGETEVFPFSDRPEEGLYADFIIDLFVDHSGVVWLGTVSYGCFRYDPHTRDFAWARSAVPPSGAGKAGSEINGVVEDRRGVLWLVSERGLERVYPPGVAAYPPPSEDLAATSGTINTITAGEDGVFWLGTERGVKRIEARTGQVRSFFQDPFAIGFGAYANTVTAALPDAAGKMWFGFWGGGVACIDRQGEVHVPPIYDCTYEHPDDVANCFVQSLAQSADGRILIGMAYGGLIRYDPTGSRPLERYRSTDTPRNGLSNNYVRALLVDRADRIWLGTYGGGLNRFDPVSRSFIRYGRKDGLPDDLIVDLVEDRRGRIWLITGSALVQFDPETETFRSFDAGDGLPPTQFNDLSGPGPQSGQLRIATRQGYVTFHPDRIRRDTVPPITTLVSLERYRRDLPGGGPVRETNLPHRQEIELGYADYMVNFKLAAISYRQPEATRLAYKLEGFNADWIQLGTERQISFTNLPAREYTLLVRGANADGAWNAEPTRLRIRVRPPWWRTWWAYLLYAGLLGAGLYYWRARELRQINLENRLERQRLLGEAKSRFFANISHEFRTPLTVILGMADEIEEKPSVRSAIRRNGQNLLRLINQILDLGRLEAGKLRLQPERRDLVPFLRYLYESYRAFAQQRGVSLSYQPAVATLEMDLDPAKLQHIVDNLLSNAIKFTPRGGRVALRLRATAERVFIAVQDTGTGIAADQLPRIFDRYYQVETAGMRSEAGTGIGLTYAKELTELMEGQLSVTSTPGEGSTFTVALPLRQPATGSAQPVTGHTDDPRMTAGQAADVRAAAAPHPQPATERPRLLIIEDSPDIVLYIRTLLRDRYAIAVAENGTEGVEKAIEEIPDIIVSDVMMPGLDGFEVTHRLKNDERTSHIPIILLTARAGIESRLTGLRQGADAYLAKPFEQRELLIRLEKLIELRRQLQARYAGSPIPAARTEAPLGTEDAFVAKVNQVIEDHLSATDLTTEQIGRELGLSQKQLSRKLKALTGQSTVSYLRRCRLYRAKDLLATGEWKVAEVAYRVGFSDPNYFSRSFSQEFGRAPTEL
jgi:signal transduction histidine kinase/ligand-binding sensor domain-containing protein/DNA-binding response OmpR family regulator